MSEATRTLPRDCVIQPPVDDAKRIEWLARLGAFRDLVAQIEDVHGVSRVRILEPRLPRLARVTAVWFLPRRIPRVDSWTGKPLGLVNTGIHLDLLPQEFRGWGEEAEASIWRGGIRPERMRAIAVDLGLLA